MAKPSELESQRFGDLVVIKRIKSNVSKTRWLCQCDCGNTTEVYAYKLRSGRTKSCGCQRNTKKFIDDNKPQGTETDPKVIREFKELGYEVLKGKYTGYQSRFLLKCLECGEEKEISWEIRHNNQRCLSCYYGGLNKKLYLRLIGKLKSLGLTTDLRLKDLKNERQLIPVTCRAKKHTYETKIATILRYTSGCQICLGTSSKRRPLELLKENGWVHVSGTNYNKHSLIKAKCQEKGHIIEKSYRYFSRSKECPECVRETCGSADEKQIKDFLESYNLEVVQGKKILNGKDIDLYVPAKKFGIEFHGLYWHSMEDKNKWDHYEKYLLAKEKGIKLLQFWEDEWRDKTEIVKSVVLNKLGICQRRIFARKCTLKELDQKIASNFLKENHLQGSCHFFSALGLFFEGELVIAATFSNHHRNVQKLPVLSRVATAKNTVVVGGLSKLLKGAPKELITWSDNRYTYGEVYEKLGFKVDERLNPDYQYVKGKNRFSKQSLRKTENEKSLGITEKELRLAEGYRLLYDAGKIRWKRSSFPSTN